MANAISQTAYYTLGVRAWDAPRAKPLCGDSFAARLMDDQAREIWRRFQRHHWPNAGNATRHRIIDDHLRDELHSDPGARVVVIGAGFDTRAFRLPGGRWIEVDDPTIISHKEARLPAVGAPNPLVRVPIDFEQESLAAKLAPFAGPERAHIVIEGVLMYLTDAQRRELLAILRNVFPRHTVYCDLMRRSFFEAYSRKVHEEIVGMGTSFADISETPEKLFLEGGYSRSASISIPIRTAQLGGVNLPVFVLRWFMPTLRDGYAIWKFDYARAPAPAGEPEWSVERAAVPVEPA
jgi:methyltransferase (TIGR00027 family)